MNKGGGGEVAIAPAIRSYLMSHGIKQTFVAEKCGWSKQKTSCIINGKSKMTAEDFQVLCKAIGAPYELFLGADGQGSDDNKPA